jgi:hypothetical protein
MWWSILPESGHFYIYTIEMLVFGQILASVITGKNSGLLPSFY